MPIYEYRCENGHTFEVMQRMTDDPVASCQTCEAPVRRLFHPVAVHFKGSGFYNTDYGKAKRGEAASDTTSADGKSPSTDKAPESKSEAKSSSTSSD
jgi:putative FmdB family regulatory protein